MKVDYIRTYTNKSMKSFYKLFFENKNSELVKQEFLKRFVELNEIHKNGNFDTLNNSNRILFLKKNRLIQIFA